MNRRYGMLVFCCLICFLMIPQTVFAATTGTGPADLITIQGSGAQCSWGDAYSANNNTGCISGATGLNTYYSYWIEVPPGTAQLQVDIFDADIGANGASGNHDTSRTAYNTAVQYTLRDPAGVIPAGFTATLGAGGCAGCDNAWATWGASPVISPAPGYWELRIDQSSAVTLGDDVNRVGIRAFDSSSNSNLNIFYYVSNMGADTSGASQTTRNYPYVTSGCFIGHQNFDFDSAGSVNLTTRLGSALPAFLVSANGDWRSSTQIFESRDDSAEDYGIWTADLTLNGSNFGAWFFYPEVGGSAAPPASRFALNDGRSKRTYLGVGTTAAPSGAPVKPYLAQWVRQHGLGSSDFTVTVRLINPTAHNVTASIVTGEIPAPVTYGGVRSGFPTISSMTSAPVMGASGSYTWTIGTVASGQTATMAYDISVPNPAVVTTVTGLVSSANATQAQYSDETNTAFATGGLCELRIGPGLTQAVISKFNASQSPDGVVIRWSTASEIGTLGFYLERKAEASGDWVRLNDEQLILGLGLSHPQGGEYEYIDKDVLEDDRNVRYRLVEVEAKGNQHLYGPYEISEENPRLTRLTTSNKSSYTVKPRLRKVAVKADAPTFLSSRENVQALNPDGIRLGIREAGLYFLSTKTIATKLNTSTQAVANAIDDTRLRLSVGGKELDWLPTTTNDGIYFYAEAIDSLYTRDNVVLLELKQGRIMSREDGGRPLETGSVDTFQSFQHFEKDVVPVLVRPVKDYWLWGWVANLVSGGNNYSQASFDFTLHDVANGSAELELNLEGYSETQHTVAVKINDSLVAVINWDGQRQYKNSLFIPSGLLASGSNTLTLIHQDITDGTSFAYLNSFDIKHQRYLTADDEMLEFYVENDTVVTVQGFDESLIYLFDIGNVYRPKLVENTTQTFLEATSQISFISGGEGKYLAVNNSAIKTPVWIEAFYNARLSAPQNEADYLLITPKSLLNGAHELANYRAASGLITRVVTLEEIYSAFNFGIEDPAAIRRFVRYAYEHWQVAPRYAVLIGDSSYDHRHVLEEIRSDSFVPAIFSETPDGLFAADNLYAAMEGNAPRVAVGRIPVRDNATLHDYVAKLQAWEMSFSADRKVQLVADNADAGVGDFPSDSNIFLKPEIPSVLLSQHDIYLDAENPGLAHVEMLDALNEGRGLVNYLGHGGMDRLAHEGILSLTDIPLLANSQTPILTALSCVVNRHEVAGVDNLGEQLVLQPEAGVVALWAPTGLSQNESAVDLNRKLLKAIYSDGNTILGDAIVAALQEYGVVNPVKHMPQVYTLLGDPAVRIRPGVSKRVRIINIPQVETTDLEGEQQVEAGNLVSCAGRRVKLQGEIFARDAECAASSHLEAMDTDVEAGVSVGFCAPVVELKSGFRVRGVFSAGYDACAMTPK